MVRSPPRLQRVSRMSATARRFSLCLHACLAVLLVPLFATTPARAEAKDAAATKLGKQAMEGDYFAMRFKQAEQKLKQALAMCGNKSCIAVVRARLHADLAVVYIAGLKKPEKGKQQIKLALDADAAIQLNPDFATPEAEQIYVDAGGIKQEPEVEEEDDGDAAEDEAARQAAIEAATPRNWVSLGIQQELVLHESRSDVCSGTAEYECFVGNASYQASASDAGDALDTGVGLGTRRVLLGYERLLFGRVTLGGRFGFAFGGRPNAVIGTTPGFNPLHAEVRASHWFGQQPPFQRKGARYFLGLGGGLGEVNDSAVAKVTSVMGQSRQVDAWRKTGVMFIGLHG